MKNWNEYEKIIQAIGKVSRDEKIGMGESVHVHGGYGKLIGTAGGIGTNWVGRIL